MRHRSARLLAAVAAAALLLPMAAPAASAGPASAQVRPTQVTDRPLLRLGDRGPSVAAWQRQMRIVTGADIEVDGVYGFPTESATADFQRFFGLRVDGIVGENTRELMRYLLVVGHDAFEIAGDLRGSGLRLVGYQGRQGYCVEVQDGDQVAVECAEATSAPIDVQLYDMGDRTVLIGTTEPGIASVEVTLEGGESFEAVNVAPPGYARSVWATAATPSDVAVVRALAGDGSEVREIVVGDETAYMVLERGDRGPRVQQWQRDLSQLTGAGIATDGIFGTNTVTATRNFQAFFGLRSDGIVGPSTRQLMDYLLLLEGAPSEDDDPGGAVGEPTSGASSTDDFPATGPESLLQDVRVGEHAGFDRVVFEFGGDVPSWQVEPVARPIYQQPSGQRVAIDGDAFLEVTMTPASAVDLSGATPDESYTGPERISVEGPGVTEILQTEDFENQLTWVVGLTEPLDYGVAELSEPSRLVIDVR